jgi:hypothetical protein
MIARIKQKINAFLPTKPIHIGPFSISLNSSQWICPPGSGSSPIPSKESILKREQQIFGIKKKEIDGIDLNEKEQLDLLECLKKYYCDLPFDGERKENLRYYFNNSWYGHCDAILLYGMIRHFKPGKIIEVGSGFSSALMLDTIEHFMQNSCQCYFIEPSPKRLLSLLKVKDEKNVIINKQVQDVNPDFFKQLQVNDILFIDSSHISKIGSDVNHILFDILPALNKGVLVHFHDIFYPFEYPKSLAMLFAQQARGDNEDYILRAFLQYNSQFEIVIFNAFLTKYYQDWFAKHMPLCLTGMPVCVTGGSSIWLRKV